MSETAALIPASGVVAALCLAGALTLLALAARRRPKHRRCTAMEPRTLGQPFLVRCDLTAGHEGQHEHDDGAVLVRWSSGWSS